METMPVNESFGRIASDLAAALQITWNRGDAQSFAALFAEDADFIHILGGHGRGRAAIAQAHRALFSGIYRQSQVQFEVAAVRPLGPDAFVALLAQTLAFGEGTAATMMRCRPSLVLRRLGEAWAIVLMHNTRTAEAPPEDLADHPFAPEPTP
jgi:uncharacterized protein (TIGR02246 family)